MLQLRFSRRSETDVGTSPRVARPMPRRAGSTSLLDGRINLGVKIYLFQPQNVLNKKRPYWRNQNCMSESYSVLETRTGKYIPIRR